MTKDFCCDVCSDEFMEKHRTEKFDSSPDICINCEDSVNECYECSDIIHEEEMYCSERNGEMYCSCCYHDIFSRCEACRDEIYTDDIYYFRDYHYCEYCYNEEYTSCYNCGYDLYRDNCSYDDDGDAYCYDCNPGCSEDSENFVKNSPTEVACQYDKSDTFDNLKVKRLVGLEIECEYERGLQDIVSNPYNWRSAYDGSLNASSSDYEAIELISKPANGDKLNSNIDSLIEWRDEYNADVNTSCGFHVHIDATDTDWIDLKSIAMVTKHIEPYLYKMMPPSRSNSRWCRKIHLSFNELKGFSSEGDFVQSWYDNNISREKYNDIRYCGLNLHARFYLGSIEFRHHSGTMNKEKITNWIKICNSIVETGMYLSKAIKENRASNNLFYNNIRSMRSLKTITRRMISFDDSMLSYMNERIKKFDRNN